MNIPPIASAHIHNMERSSILSIACVASSPESNVTVFSVDTSSKCKSPQLDPSMVLKELILKPGVSASTRYKPLLFSFFR